MRNWPAHKVQRLALNPDGTMSNCQRDLGARPIRTARGVRESRRAALEFDLRSSTGDRSRDFGRVRYREMSIDESPQLLQRGVGEWCTCSVAISGDQSRDGRPSRRIVHQHDPLPAGARSPEHVAHFEPHAVARARGLGNEDIAPRQPLDVASKHLGLGELRLGVLDIVGQEMRREDVMTMMLKAFADGTPGQHATAIAADGAR